MFRTAGVTAAGYSFPREQFGKTTIKDAALAVVVVIFCAINGAF
jgi:hypothetical protein